jgi:hypothetical protein
MKRHSKTLVHIFETIYIILNTKKHDNMEKKVTTMAIF